MLYPLAAEDLHLVDTINPLLTAESLFDPVPLARFTSAVRIPCSHAECLVQFAGGGLSNERAINGSFATDSDWTKGSGWTIAAGVADAAAGAGSDLSQATRLVIGNTYKFTFTVANRTAGSITPKAGTAAGTARSTNGTFTENIVCAGNTSIIFSKDATFDGDIDNVSVVEVTPKVNLNVYPHLSGDASTPPAGVPSWRATAAKIATVDLATDVNASLAHWLMLDWTTIGSGFQIGLTMQGPYTQLQAALWLRRLRQRQEG